MPDLRKSITVSDNGLEEKPDTKKNLRETVNLILPDSLMIVLAVLMAPLVLIPIFVDLPNSIATTFHFFDYTILGVFIVEYVSKTVLASNIIKHVLNPWHILDLLVILLPLIGFIPAVSGRLSVSSPLLRLLRIARIAAVGGRAIDRKRQLSMTVGTEETPRPPIRMRVMDGTLENTQENVPIAKLAEYLRSPAETWVDISCVAEDDFDLLSNMLGIPRILLESEMVDESYPRVDYFERYSLIFARIADVIIQNKGPARLAINRTGLLVICQGQNIITLSKEQTDVFNQILKDVRKIHSPEDPIVVSILYALLKHVLAKDKKIVTALETELMILESIPLGKRPSNFLEATFYLRKEVNQLVPSLLHLKEVITVITSKRVPLKGFEERHEKIFDILMDEAAYLHETASNARDNLLSLIDLHINTTSYEMNRVMRVIAVITCLSIIPAILGLLGSNIAGNPWDVQLWQVFTGLGIAMLALGWIFYRMGWLKM
jgi:Mg2+ and Co2+ transporter CorA